MGGSDPNSAGRQAAGQTVAQAAGPGALVAQAGFRQGLGRRRRRRRKRKAVFAKPHEAIAS